MVPTAPDPAPHQHIAPAADWAFVRASLRRFWFLLPLFVVAGVAATLVLGSDDPDLYRSEADVIIAPTTSFSEAYQTVDALNALNDRYTQGTYADLLRSSSMIAAAGARAGVDPEALRGVEVTATLAQESYVVHITVDAPTARQAAALNSALISASISRFETAYPVFSLTTLEAPTTPEAPLSASLLNDLVLVAAAACVLWALVAVVLNRVLR